MTRPTITKKPDGEYMISAAGVLLLCADAIYGDPDQTTPAGRKKAVQTMDGILNAAVAGGFNQRDILETLLSRNDNDPRTVAMAQAACDAADNDRLVSVIAGTMGGE